MTAELDEPIEVVSYDPEWPRLFAQEVSRLRPGLSSEIVAIEHFGSTSVPGMTGKPVVDLLVGARDMEQAHLLAEQATALGYENFGEVLVPGRVYARRRGPPHFNFVSVEHNGDRWNYFLMVRDYLRAHPDEVAAYSEAKRATVVDGSSTFLDYSYKKAPFLKELAERARQWKLATIQASG